MRTVTSVVLLAAGLRCACAAPARAADAAAEHDARSGIRVPADLFPSGCEPDEVRARLAAATDAEVSRACGNISSPWAFRGRAGRRLTLRDFGRHRAGPEWTRTVAALLADAPVDTAYRVPSVQSDCSAAGGLPIYLVRFEGPGRPTFAVVRFDLAVVQLFDAEHPLGMIELGVRSDSLWSAMTSLLDDDPLLRRPRPAAGDTAARLHGDQAWVRFLPEVLERVAPDYPKEARRTRTEGTVWVRALVGPDGAVRDAFVVSGPPALRDASLDALWRWRFQPALDAGRPTAAWIVVPVLFTLR